jgi:hypothetical protein
MQHTRCGRGCSSNRMALRVIRLAIHWSEFTRFSQRNELPAEVCGSLVLCISQLVIFFNPLGCLKGKVNESNPQTLDEIRKNIRSAIETIQVAVLPTVNLNTIAHAPNCLIHKDLITNISCKCVRLVNQKLNKTKPS